MQGLPKRVQILCDSYMYMSVVTLSKRKFIFCKREDVRRNVTEAADILSSIFSQMMEFVWLMTAYWGARLEVLFYDHSITQSLVALVVVSWEWQEPVNGSLSFCECKVSGGDTQNIPAVTKFV